MADAVTLQEIEQRLRDVPGVRDVVVTSSGPPSARRSSVPLETAAAPIESGRRSRNVGTQLLSAGGAPGHRSRAVIHSAPLPPDPILPTTLPEALRRAAESTPDKGTTYLRQHGESERQPYHQLLHDARCVLGGFQSEGLHPGDALILQLGDSRNYVTAFWACQLGGLVPTPVGIAPTYRRDNAVIRRLRHAWDLLGRPIIVADAALLDAVSDLRELWQTPNLRVVALEQLGGGRPAIDWRGGSPQDIAVQLLTSGSTGVPKCVRLSHRAVLDRTRSTAFACGLTADDITMNWMPLDHVAIVMYNVRDVIVQCDHVNAPTADILADPLTWLASLDRYRATNTWAPNFAFALVNDRLENASGRSWDLSCVREIVNAGEQVMRRVVDRFCRLLHRYGLAANAVTPCWGMSETCSGVTYAKLAMKPSDPAGSAGFVDVGHPIPGVGLRIVSDDGKPVAEGQVGQLEITGVTMFSGYHSNVAADRESTTPDGWFRTGDLAFLHDGSLTITGRVKEQIIVHGTNYAAPEIEAVVERVTGVEPACAAAVGLADETTGSDRLVLFFVPFASEAAKVPDIVSEVRSRVSEDIGVPPHLVIPLRPEEFPRTASGKIQRGQLLQQLRDGLFDARLTDIDSDDEREAGALLTKVWVAAPESLADDATRAPPKAGCWLVFGDDTVFHALGPALGSADRVITVGAGAGFAEVGHDAFTVRPTVAEDYRRLIAEMPDDLSVVLHGWGLALPDESGTGGTGRAAATTNRVVALTTHSVLCLLQVLPHSSVELLVLTGHGRYVVTPQRLDWATAGLGGLLRTAVAEGFTTVRHVDLAEDAPDTWSDDVLTELGRTDGEVVVAIRDGRRRVPRLRPARTDSDRSTAPLVRGGLYVLTGGLGGIGFEVARYLVGAYGCRVVLIGRTPATAGSRPARCLAELNELGEVSYVSADVTDLPAMRDAVAQAEQRWGRQMDGVFHLAAESIVDNWLDLGAHALRSESSADFERAYQAKIHGLLAIQDILEDRPHALLVLFSSVTGEFGATAFGAYASANSCLDGFAEYWANVRARPVKCIAWSLWQDTGMGRTTPIVAATQRGFTAMSVSQGLASLESALRSAPHYLLVGVDREHSAVRHRIDPTRATRNEIVVAYTADRPVSREELSATLAASLDPNVVAFVRVTRMPRGTDGSVDRSRLQALAPHGARRRRYAEPVGAVEVALADVVGSVLGVVAGRDDTFFELGASSLHLAQLVVTINSKLGTGLTVQRLYENPSVAALSQVLGPTSAKATSDPPPGAP